METRALWLERMVRMLDGKPVALLPAWAASVDEERAKATRTIVGDWHGKGYWSKPVEDIRSMLSLLPSDHRLR